MTVVLVDPRRPALVPVEAAALLAGDVQYTEEMPVRVPWSLPAARPAYTGEPAPVLLSSDPDHPEVRARVARGDRVMSAPAPQPGERLVDAVALMDTLRTRGPWEAQQTHATLRRYLLEETYELFDAIDGIASSGSEAIADGRDALRGELGDVLLQVLFHARIAADDPQQPFDIDDVADALIRKLTHRVPAVLAGQEVSLAEQLAQWEERKAAERARGSCLDGVPLGQPALALAEKVIGRAVEAGVPAELIPAAITTVAVGPGVDAENQLRAETLRFVADLRSAERTIASERRVADPAVALVDAADDGPGAVTAEEWRLYWPGAPSVLDVTSDDADDADVADDAAVPDAPVPVPHDVEDEVADPPPAPTG